MDVVVKSRHCSVSDQFRSYVDEKITRLEKRGPLRLKVVRPTLPGLPAQDPRRALNRVMMNVIGPLE